MGMFADADPKFPIDWPSAVAQGVTPGKVTKRILESDPEQEYFVYVPEDVMEGAPVLVSVHGISRNAKTHAKAFSPFADRYGIVVVAPLFPGKKFPGYQRLGLSRRRDHSRPDLTLHAILSEVGTLTGARTDRIYLFGYSGGGQFAHRYAMFYPERVLAVAVGAPGWYTFPDEQARFPRGLDLPPREDLPRPSSRDFSRVPMAVFVGRQDDQRDATLKTSRRVDAQQGLTRVDRGRRWVDAMRAVAAGHGHDTRYEYRVLSECGHSFRRCMRRGNMDWYVFEFLFGSRAGRRAEGGTLWGNPLPVQFGLRVLLNSAPGGS
jgi:pimeloyl-ACP methyl ester carboxylesterase